MNTQSSFLSHGIIQHGYLPYADSGFNNESRISYSSSNGFVPGPHKDYIDAKFQNGQSSMREGETTHNGGNTEGPLLTQKYFDCGYNAANASSYMNGGRTTVMPMIMSWPVTSVNSQWPVIPIENVNPTICDNTSTNMTYTNSLAMNNGSAAVGMGHYSYTAPLPTVPNMYGMVSYGSYMYGSNPNMVIPPVRLSRCVLYPHSCNISTTRKKPVGCRTIFVGGIPANCTKEIIKEVFQCFGEILAVRLNSKRFCHVRFANEESVDRAIIYSGYRMKIDDKDDEPNTGRLHVDYAEAQTDLRDYMYQQQTLQRVACHQDKSDQNVFLPPSPPPVPHYSEHEAANITGKLKREDGFLEGLSVLITWLERGECHKRNANIFYQMIQSTHSHVIFLKNEKIKCEEQLQRAKTMLMQKSRAISLKFKEVDKVFHAASLQKVWDHFTRAQRKKIEDCRKEAEEIEAAHVREIVKERNEVDMELDDSDDDVDKSLKKAENNEADHSDVKMDLLSEIETLRKEKANLQHQLKRAQTEIAFARLEANNQNKQAHNFKQALENAQKKYLTLSTNQVKDGTDFVEQNQERMVQEMKGVSELGDFAPSSENMRARASSELHLFSISPISSSNSISSTYAITENHVRFIGLIAMFLSIHPFGANINHICSYIRQIGYIVHDEDIQLFMKQFPSVFKEQSSEIGDTVEKKWTFYGFKADAV